MRKALFAGVLVVVGLVAAYLLSTRWLAPRVDAAALTECLVANTTDEQISEMMPLLVGAPEGGWGRYGRQDVDAKIDDFVSEVTSQCNIAAWQLNDPAVGEALQAYGQRIVEKRIGRSRQHESMPEAGVADK